MLRLGKRQAYQLCSVSELAQHAAQCSSPSAVQPPVGTHLEDWIVCTAGGGGGGGKSYRYRFNAKGRLVMETCTGREIVVFMDPRDVAGTCRVERETIATGDAPRIYALDKNCYHIGYPIDLGAIEDLPCVGGHVVMCISCPLHNRLFDVRTGDLVGIDYSSSQSQMLAARRDGVESDEISSRGDRGDDTHRISSGKRKGGAVFSAGCHQRSHRVDVTAGGTIVVIDSTAESGEDVATRQLPSDEQNVERDEEKE